MEAMNKSPLQTIGLMAAMLGATSYPMRCEYAPTPTADELLKKAMRDAECLAAAQAKRAKKLLRWTQTPDALKRKAETLANLELGLIWSFRAKAYAPGVAQTFPDAVEIQD